MHNLTPEQAKEKALKHGMCFCKFVKTNKGYYIGHADLATHSQLYPIEETPISAGFVGIFRGGEEFSLRNERSSTLQMGRDENDLAGLTDFLGIPGTQAD